MKFFPMRTLLLSLFLLSMVIGNAQSEVFEPSDPQVIYEMFVESVEPIHDLFDELNLTNSRPRYKGQDVLDLHSKARHRLETFHKDRLHRDAYTAALTYLDNMKPVGEELAPVLDDLQIADEDALAELMARLHDITIKEKHHAEVYRTDIREVIDMFTETWDKWLEDEVIYFSRLTAHERNVLYESGFGEKGLKSVKRRFYSAEYFVLNMDQNVDETRINSIKASFHDLSTLPDHMVQNVDEFLTSVEEPLLRYGYTKEVKDNVYTYSKGSETVFDFVVKRVVVTVHSRASNTLTIEFDY